jgi:hypothetical protein
MIVAKIVSSLAAACATAATIAASIKLGGGPGMLAWWGVATLASGVALGAGSPTPAAGDTIVLMKSCRHHCRPITGVSVTRSWISLTEVNETQDGRIVGPAPVGAVCR